MSAEPVFLSIDGMSCAGCVRSVERALNTVNGVSAVSVNFAGQSALVAGDVDAGLLIAAVQQAGYHAGMQEQLNIAEEDALSRARFYRALGKSALALAAAMFLMLDMYLGWLPPLSHLVTWSIIGLVTLFLMGLTGGHFFRGAAAALRYRTATMDTLIALGTGVAWGYSMFVVFLPEFVPEQSQYQFFEAALFVIGFVNLGKAIEHRARSSSSMAIRRLLDTSHRVVTLLTEDDVQRTVDVDQVQVGDRLLIKPGESIVVDATVVSGQGYVNEAMFSGESAPVTKGSGDPVYAGTLNVDGRLVLVAESLGEQTRLAGIVAMIQRAQNSKPDFAHRVDDIAAYFVPVIALVALVAAATWTILGLPEIALVAFMSVLIVACPCALGLAIPMSVMVGLGRAAEQGLLIRDAGILETAARIDTLIVDKTGTLTRGAPDVVAAPGLDPEHFALVRHLLGASTHPLSQAIVNFLESRQGNADGKIDASVEVENFTEHAGLGVSGLVAGVAVSAGSARFLEAQGTPMAIATDLEGSVVYVGVNQQYAGHFLIEDLPREQVADELRQLRASGLRLVMATGDNPSAANAVANVLGIDEVHAGMSPEDKLVLVEREQSAGRVVGMIGDGINDAAALAQADASFAIGAGTEAARQSADITLTSASLLGVERAMALSSRVLSNVRQNLIAAFFYNLCLVPIAAGLLFPALGILLNPALAGLAMALSSISVVANAFRLRLA